MKAALDKFLEYILISLMLLMVLTVVWQVFSRYISNNPSSITTELSGFLLIWVSILGAAYAIGKNMHMAIDLLPSTLTGKKKINLLRIINIIISAFSLLVMVLGGGQLVKLSFQLNQISPTLQISIGYIYLIIPISGIIMLYYSINFIIKIKKR